MIYITLSMIAGALGLYFLFKDLNYFKKHGVLHVKPFLLVGNIGPLILHRQSINDFVKSRQGVWIPAFEIQWDPKCFEDPEKFDPERFRGERKKDSLDCGYYFPFGLGPRMYTGNRFALLETKVLLFHLLARCKLEPCDKTPKSIKFAKSFTIKPEGGFWLNVIPRKNFFEKNIS